jgi:hypothetical protein
MKKCTINYFKYYNHEISFNRNINYIHGLNASGKTTLILIIQHSLGLISIPPKFILPTKTVIRLTVDNCELQLTRDIDSDKIIIENDTETLEFNIKSEKYDNYLISLFIPIFKLTTPSQIKTLIKESFYSLDYNIETRNKISQNNLMHLMLGVDRKYEEDIKRKIKILSENLKEKERSANILEQYKNDVLRSIHHNCDTKTNILMNNIYEKYRDELLSERSLIEQSEYTLEQLTQGNNYRIDKSLECLDLLSIQLQRNKTQDIHMIYNDIIFKKNDYQSFSNRIQNEFLLKLAIQSGYLTTNGIGVFFNDNQFHALSSSKKVETTETIETATRLYDLQYIGFISDTSDIDESKIIHKLNRDIFHG